MHTLYKVALLATVLLGLSISVIAHDPSEHKKNAEQPDCVAFDNMDRSKISVNDPIMQAMMKQCDGHHNHESKDNNGDDKSNNKPTKKSDKQG